MSTRRAGPSRYGSSRQVGIRPTRPVVIVVCDDAQTAVKYFYEIKREVKDGVTVEVVPAPCHGASADKVLQLAIEHRKALREEKSHARQDKDLVWALIDLEAEPHKQSQAREAQGEGTRKGVNVALSMPCFEVWTLAHFVDTGEAFQNCAAVLDRLKTEWAKRFNTELRKAQADYSKLMQYRGQAVQWSKRRKARKDQSWTEVYKVVEAIESLASGQ